MQKLKNPFLTILIPSTLIGLFWRLMSESYKYIVVHFRDVSQIALVISIILIISSAAFTIRFFLTKSTQRSQDKKNPIWYGVFVSVTAAILTNIFTGEVELLWKLLSILFYSLLGIIGTLISLYWRRLINKTAANIT